MPVLVLHAFKQSQLLRLHLIVSRRRFRRAAACRICICMYAKLALLDRSNAARVAFPFREASADASCAARVPAALRFGVTGDMLQLCLTIDHGCIADAPMRVSPGADRLVAPQLRREGRDLYAVEPSIMLCWRSLLGSVAPKSLYEKL